MGEQAAAGFEPVELVEIRVRQYCCKLKNLVERGVCACSLSVVKYKVQSNISMLKTVPTRMYTRKVLS